MVRRAHRRDAGFHQRIQQGEPGGGQRARRHEALKKAKYGVRCACARGGKRQKTKGKSGGTGFSSFHFCLLFLRRLLLPFANECDLGARASCPPVLRMREAASILPALPGFIQSPTAVVGRPTFAFWFLPLAF